MTASDPLISASLSHLLRRFLGRVIKGPYSGVPSVAFRPFGLCGAVAGDADTPEYVYAPCVCMSVPSKDPFSWVSQRPTRTVRPRRIASHAQRPLHGHVAVCRADQAIL